MLIELHILQNYAPSSLNRDELGSPKSCMFGGFSRGRISSQCLKRALRDSDILRDAFSTLGESIQTRMLPEQVRKELISRGIPNTHAALAIQKVASIGTKSNRGQGAKEQSSSKKVLTSQTICYSVMEQGIVADVLEEALQGAKDEEEVKQRLKKLKLEEAVQKGGKGSGRRLISPEIALFGRMITSDIFRTIESSVQVSHAISTNQMEMEYDYYITTDQLQHHAAMIGELEYNSNCYYKYFNIDLDTFVANLSISNNGEDETEKDEMYSYAIEILEAFVKAVVFVNDYGKQNSFAAFQLPSAILVEVKDTKIPLNYSNAFLSPVRPKIKENLVEGSIRQFRDFVNHISQKFGTDFVERLWFTDMEYDGVAIDGATECDTLDDLISSIQTSLKE